MKYVNVGTVPISVTSGASVAPGEAVEIKDLDQHDQAHIDGGRLLPAVPPKKKERDE